MQIAGARCAVCDRHVGTMREGLGCEPCKVVVHKLCAPTGVCPSCGTAFLPADVVHSRPNRASQARLARPQSITALGRLTLLGVPLWTLVTIVRLGQVGDAGSGGLPPVVEGLIGVGYSLAMGNGLLKGLAWSRRFFLWGTPLLMAADIVFDSNQLFRPGFNSGLFALQAGAYLTWLFFLTRPKARAFFDKAQTSVG